MLSVLAFSPQLDQTLSEIEGRGLVELWTTHWAPTTAQLSHRDSIH